MPDLLRRLNALPGVLGSMRCDGDGRPLAHALPPGQMDVALHAAAEAAADSLRALGDVTGPAFHLDLHYPQRRLLVVPVPGGSLLLVCEKAVNARLVLAGVAEIVPPQPAAPPAARPAAAGPARPAPAAPVEARPVARPVPTAPPRAPEPPPPAPAPPSPRRRLAGLAAAAAAVLVVGAVVAWWASSGPAPRARTAAPAEVPAAAEPSVLLRIGGAKSFAAELAPALAKAYLESLDVKDVAIQKLDGFRFSVRGTREGRASAVEVEGTNTPDGFPRLADGSFDIAMSGRRIRPEWQEKLAAHGSMMVPGREHVVALSGIAVIVNQANQVPQLTRAQLEAIFTGAVKDWAEVGGSPGPLQVYAGDDKMGLTELFRTLVMGKAGYRPDARRLATLQEIADGVALDPKGVGYVTLAFVRGVRAVPVAEADSAALVPTAFTLATEDYFLTHRLYFYVLPRPERPHASKFVQFALSAAGQAVVKQTGYVELSVAAAPREPPPGAPEGYVRLTERAVRLSSTFRFEPGSSAFDSRALVDLERVTTYLVESRLNGGAVRVLGFADAMGKRAVNDALSQARADQVAKAFAQRGIVGVAVDGFGSALPVASNATADGRERNRRVEVWVVR